jgi:DsbC/DsbD-like thiol-disulfide interchange protein
LRRALGVLLLWSIAGWGSPALGEEAASRWLDLPHSRARLIAAGGLTHEGRTILVAALEISLDKGWKTYWRSPGDGLAPAFDWGGSAGLAEAETLWPAPKRFEEPTGTSSNGYKDRLVLPFRIAPAVTGGSVRLKLKANFAVCAEICIPVEAELALEVAPELESRHRDVIVAALESVPRRQARGVFCPHNFITARRRTVNGKPALIVKTANVEAATGLDLFVEAPSGAELPRPRRQPRATRGRLYHILGFEAETELDALRGKMLTLTMTADQGSCETTWRVE